MARIEISSEIISKIKERLSVTGFSSVEEYIEYVMNEILCIDVGKIKKSGKEKTKEEKVKERLKELGY